MCWSLTEELLPTASSLLLFGHTLDEEADNKGKKEGGLVIGRGGLHLCMCDIDNFVIFVKGGSIHIIMINSDFGINFGMYKCGNV